MRRTYGNLCPDVPCGEQKSSTTDRTIGWVQRRRDSRLTRVPSQSRTRVTSQTYPPYPAIASASSRISKRARQWLICPSRTVIAIAKSDSHSLFVESALNRMNPIHTTRSPLTKYSRSSSNTTSSALPMSSKNSATASRPSYSLLNGAPSGPR